MGSVSEFFLSLSLGGIRKNGPTAEGVFGRKALFALGVFPSVKGGQGIAFLVIHLVKDPVGIQVPLEEFLEIPEGIGFSFHRYDFFLTDGEAFSFILEAGFTESKAGLKQQVFLIEGAVDP